MSATDTTEPAVLADAVDFLTPDAERAHSVVDAQFGRSSWGSESIPEAVQTRLTPVSTLSTGAGHPDAMVAPPVSDAYRDPAGEHTDSIPLAVVEAKGTRPGSDSDPDADRIALTQAHAHLETVNVGYAALPSNLVRERSRALARETNTGLLAVADDGVRLLERPRLVGANTTETTDTVRFHARVGGVTVENLRKNHPKNALGYTLAVASGEPTAETFQTQVIDSVADSRGDAVALGLVDDRFGREQLTELGRETVRTLTDHYGGVTAALSAIGELTGSQTRLRDALPVAGVVARQALLAYPPTQVLVDTLSDLASSGTRRPSLATVARAVATDRPGLALELFVPAGDRDRAVDANGGIDLDAFEDPSIYATHTTFQYKAMLYHAGLLTERGTGSLSELEPEQEEWALETVV